MNLRELMIERILFCMDEEMLESEYALNENDLKNLSDVDFLEMYDIINSVRYYSVSVKCLPLVCFRVPNSKHAHFLH